MELVLFVIEEGTDAMKCGEATAIDLARALERLARGTELAATKLRATDEREARGGARTGGATPCFGGVGILERQDLGDAGAARGEARTEQAIVHAGARVQPSLGRGQINRRLATVELRIDITAQVIGLRAWASV